MAKVTFVQIGNDSMSHSDYQSKLSTALTQYPGAIIFGTYFDSTKQKTCQEIWANGKQYSVGAGSDARFYDSSLTPEAYFTEHSEIKPLHGDYYIQTSPLNPSSEYDQDIDADTQLPVQRKTAYVYDSTVLNNNNEVTGGWVVLDGNVSADNVYFPDGIRHNQKWGKYDQQNTSTTDWVGYNLTHVLKDVLLVSAEPIDPSVRPNKVSDPTVTVSSNDALTWGVYDVSVMTEGHNKITGSDNWFHVGTKLYIPADTSIEYTGYNLTRTSEDETLTEGGAEIYNMQYGYWDSSADIGKKSKATIASSKVGDSVDVSFYHDASQTDGNCRLKLTSSHITYNANGSTDDVSTNTPSDVDHTILSLTSSATRVFTVEDRTDGTITLTGTNGNTWKATRNSYDIPAVGPIWVANNEYDKGLQKTYDPSVVSAATITSEARSGKVSSIGIKGYWPIYSNHTQSTYGTTTYVLNDTGNSRNSYTWTFNPNWASNGKAGSDLDKPIIFEYPATKTLVFKFDNQDETSKLTNTTVQKTIAGKSVNYTKSELHVAFTTGATFKYTIS